MEKEKNQLKKKNRASWRNPLPKKETHNAFQ
jgi:hypothetical protein